LNPIYYYLVIYKHKSAKLGDKKAEPYTWSKTERKKKQTKPSI